MMGNQNSVIVAAIQAKCDESPHRNVDRTKEMIATAAKQGAELICLQEMFSIRYPCQTEDHRNFALAEPIPDGPTCAAIASSALEHGVVVVASIFERRAPGVYHNSVVVYERDGQAAGMYRKMHIPDDPNYYEKFYFTPGDLGFQSIPTSVGNVGPCICWDQWFPEAARITSLRGADFLVYPTAIGWLHDEKSTFGQSQTDAWKTMLRSHAIANGVFVIAPNRVGIEDNIEFWGSSFICDPNGKILSEAGADAEEVVVAACQLDQIDVVRTHWPFLRDRRIDAYQDLLRRYVD